jgi:hypothetical protein
MAGWVLLLGGLLALVLASRLGTPGQRRPMQGVAMLAAAIGGILLARQPGVALLPGTGQRQWRQP